MVYMREHTQVTDALRLVLQLGELLGGCTRHIWGQAAPASARR